MSKSNFVLIRQVRWLLAQVLCFALIAVQSVAPAIAQQASAGVSAQSGAAKQPDTGVLPQDSGALGLQNMLRKLHTTARLLQTTAHPDDEDGGMLVYESRFKGADVMLLTLTRGDGGQNKTGSNFFDELGVLRTLELLESGKYYGVKQRFSRVADFGFSKSAIETFEKWGGKEVPLAEMVRVIRTFRPDVVAGRFSGTPRDGHGNHQASGIITPEAVRAAADPNRFPEQIQHGLLPWRVKKVYMGLRGPDDYSVRIDAGQNYPPLGMSFAQFGIEGYSHQKSQNAQVFQIPPGPSYRTYKLVDSALGPITAGTHENDFFDGIDTSIPGLADRLGDEQSKIQNLKAALIEIENKVKEATEAATSDPVKAATPLLAGRRLSAKIAQEAEASSVSPDAKAFLVSRLQEKEQQFQNAANLALGLSLKAYMHDAGSQKSVNPGQTFALRVAANAPPAVTSEAVEVLGWKSKPVAATAQSWDFQVMVPPDAPYTRPYWHRHDPERDNVYTIDDPKLATLPLPPAPAEVRLRYKVGREEGSIASAIKASASDPRRDLAVVPPFSVLLEHAAHVVPTTSHASLEVKVEVQKNFVLPTKAAVRLNVPAGWKVTPASQVTEFSGAGDSKFVSFTVTPGALKEGNYELSAGVDHGGKTYHEGFSVVGREDLDTFYYYQPASQRVSAVDVKMPANLRIGYVMGAGDDIPPVLEHLGMQIKQLTTEDVERGDLSQFGTIVIGIRAYDTREDVRKNNKRFLDFAANGGTLIVQNNFSTDDFNKGNFTPYPAQLSRERVSVEEAPVQILSPDDPIFHYPNEITAHDFDGWVQERGVNFMSTWDEHFTPLLASGDPGETPLKGGMLRARFGKGTYIYTGYAFFRQLPAGVPGAVRLYVNLVSAGHEPAK